MINSLFSRIFFESVIRIIIIIIFFFFFRAVLGFLLVWLVKRVTNII